MNIAIILSGGVGTRMGTKIPKQYIEVAGRPVLAYCIDSFEKCERIDAFIIALADEWKGYVQSNIQVSKPLYFCEPGETREHSIYNALKCAKKEGYADEDIVIIHDAVRPMVSKQLITDCLDGAAQYDAAIATIDVKDTIYMSEADNCITSVPKRANLHAGQTPEAFKLGKYLKIHDECTYEEICAVTGGAEFAYRCGLKVFLSKGAEINFKLTTTSDLDRFKQIVEAKRNGK